MKKIDVDFPAGGMKSYKIGEDGIVYGVKPAGAKGWNPPTIPMMMLGSVQNISEAYTNIVVDTFSKELREGFYPVAIDGEGARVLRGRITSVKNLKS